MDKHSSTRIKRKERIRENDRKSYKRNKNRKNCHDEMQLQAMHSFIYSVVFAFFLMKMSKRFAVFLSCGIWQGKFFACQTNHLKMGVFSDLLRFKPEKVGFVFSSLLLLYDFEMLLMSKAIVVHHNSSSSSSSSSYRNNWPLLHDEHSLPKWKSFTNNNQQ